MNKKSFMSQEHEELNAKADSQDGMVQYKHLITAAHTGKQIQSP